MMIKREVSIFFIKYVFVYVSATCLVGLALTNCLERSRKVNISIAA